MKFSKHIRIIIGSVCVIIGIIIIGCGGRASVSLRDYEPVFTGGQSLYKGKRVYLMNFENQAKDTTIWYYYSTDRKFSYGIGTLIHNYFWYGFRDALVKVGMIVSNVDNPDLSAPAMWLTLMSITDEHFQVKVTVQRKGETVFVERYEVKEPTLLGDKRTPANLEKRGYKMTTRLFETILGDPAFKRIFL